MSGDAAAAVWRLPTGRSRDRFLLVLIIASGALAVWLAAPIAGALFLGAVLAVVLYPLHLRFGGKSHPVLAGTSVTLLAILFLGVPIAALSVLAAREAADAAYQIATVLDEEGTDGVIERLPSSVRSPARSAMEWLSWSRAPRGAEGGEAPTKPDAEAANGSAEVAPSAAPRLPDGMVSNVLAFGAYATQRLLGLLLDCVIAVLAMFCLLAWGESLVKWFRAMAPLPPPQSDRLVTELRDVTRGVVVATFCAAVAQTIVATVGFAIAGVSSLPFLALCTMVGAIIPVVGGAVVVCIVGVVQVLHGEAAWGLFLIGWGVTAVNLTESFLAPWLSAGRVRIHAALVLFAMIGGIAVFGALGIVAGPMIAAFFRSVVELTRDPPPMPVMAPTTGS